MKHTNDQTLSAETQKLLYRYFNAAVNLYGMIPLYKLLEIYNSQNEPISEIQFLNFIDNIDYSKVHFGVIGDDEVYNDESETEPMNRNLVAEYMYITGNFDDYCMIREEQFGKPYYIPNKEKFLKYEDESYFEKTLEFISLRTFFRNQSYLSKEQADKYASDIQLFCVIDNANPDFLVHYAIKRGLKLDTAQICDEFIGLVIDLSNHTRKHINCGHTPDELF